MRNKVITPRIKLGKPVKSPIRKYVTNPLFNLIKDLTNYSVYRSVYYSLDKPVRDSINNSMIRL